MSATSPQTLFGGTWQRIQGRFLLCAGGGYTAGSTGGEASHALTVDEMPAHDHSGTISVGPVGDSTHATNLRYVAGTFNDPTRNASTSLPSQGGGAAHNNMPPYLAVYAWKRTA